MRKKIIFIVTLSLIFLAMGYFLMSFSKKNQSFIQVSPQINAPTISATDTSPQNILPAEKNEPAKNTTEESKVKPATTIQQSVPFIVQAPFGNWQDPDFQNACEEASIAMAMGWVNGEKNISSSEAQKRISEIINFENKTFGYSADTDIVDMKKIFQQDFKYKNIAIKENITLADLKNEIENGKLVIVPAFGRALKNPNFTSPGPVAHMLVIIGYDSATQKFITNDPGTRKGADYRYGEQVLFDSIWSYPSGKDIPAVPTISKMQKAMLVVSKE
ncbi:MAG: C39 family peptidase [Candidatus Moraniibacteriota bacterium]